MNRRYVSIFLSSTFRDMQAERDWIKKRVLPRLREALEPYGVTIHITDLRWGVDTASESEDDRENKVLRVCLDAIDRDRPYFIGLIGRRYGWIPSVERMRRLYDSLSDPDKVAVGDISDKSVTELEMLLGALGSRQLLPHSFFFFRDDCGYDLIPQQFRDTYCDRDPGMQSRIAGLRSHVADTFAKAGLGEHVNSYGFGWDDENRRICGLESFGEMVYQAVFNDIISDVAADDQLSAFDAESQALHNFITGKLENFSGRKQIVDTLSGRLLDFDPLLPLEQNGWFLIGDSGSGKSAVFARIHECLEDAARRDDRIILLAHAAGVTKDSTNVRLMVDRWNRQLSAVLGVESAALDGTDLFGNLLWQASMRGFRPVILVDSYDSFDMPANDYYEWDRVLLDFSFIPGNIPFVCTSVPGKVERYVDRRESYDSVDLDMFTKDEAIELIDKSLAASTKELSSEIRDKLLSRRCPDGTPAFVSPFWLSMVMALLDELDDNDFRNIESEHHTRDDLKINSYLLRLVSGLPTDVEGLFDRFVELSGRYFPERITLASMVFSSVAESGVDETELETLLGDDWDELQFACMARWFHRFFRRSPLTGRWQLTHSRLKDHVVAANGGMVDELRDRYIDVLIDRMDSVDDPGVADEMMFQIIMRNDVCAFGRMAEVMTGFIMDDQSVDFPFDRIMHWVPERISVGHMLQFCTLLVGAVMDGDARLLANPRTEEFISTFFDQSFLADITMKEREGMLCGVIHSVSPDKLMDGNSRKMNLFIELCNCYCSLFENYPSKRVDEEFEYFYKIFQKVFNLHGPEIIHSSVTAKNLFRCILEYARMPWRRLIDNTSRDERDALLDDPEQKYYREMKRRADMLIDMSRVIVSRFDGIRGFVADRLEIFAKDKMGTKFLYEDCNSLNDSIESLRLTADPVPDPDSDLMPEPDVAGGSAHDAYCDDMVDAGSVVTEPMSPLDEALTDLRRFIDTEIIFNAGVDYDRLVGLAIKAADMMAGHGDRPRAARMMVRIGAMFVSYLANIQFAYQTRRTTDHFKVQRRDYIYIDYKIKPHVTASKIVDWLDSNGYGEYAEDLRSRVNPFLSVFHRFSSK